ncbi:flagellar biosynthesis protein FlgD [Shewanella sp. Scap07]|uniref:flagellar hook assembly protein FlgD n=1 Tax=Shewanella sp. Scap07 TaxID=2589987 RepID=UPI0015BFB454|nr:flagellar hook capping FlgD N-terminal domain-containing protein [Shewanella sp. Scap07]QLE87559.1 flagellar biosynthesis protein FlgD [Shewanella sp. Scap07]
MSVQALTSQQDTGTQGADIMSSAGSAAGTIKNDFMTLMLASIQNQDPTSPIDSNEFVSQMAQISQVESLEHMRANQAMSMIMMENLGIVQSAQLIGKSAMVPANEFTLGDDTIDGKVYLESGAEELEIEIKNDQGEVVETIVLGPQDSGDIAFSIDPEELDLPAGDYEITAKVTAGEETSNADTFIKAPIEKVHFVSASGVMMAELGNGLGTISVLEISEVS